MNISSHHMTKYEKPLCQKLRNNSARNNKQRGKVGHTKCYPESKDYTTIAKQLRILSQTTSDHNYQRGKKLCLRNESPHYLPKTSQRISQSNTNLPIHEGEPRVTSSAHVSYELCLGSCGLYDNGSLIILTTAVHRGG